MNGPRKNTKPTKAHERRDRPVYFAFLCQDFAPFAVNGFKPPSTQSTRKVAQSFSQCQGFGIPNGLPSAFPTVLPTRCEQNPCQVCRRARKYATRKSLAEPESG